MPAKDNGDRSAILSKSFIKRVLASGLTDIGVAHRDLLFLTALLAIAGLLLIPFKGGQLPNGWMAAASGAVGLILFAVWLRRPVAAAPAKATGLATVELADFYAYVVLAVATLVLFYRPMTLFFDSGTDLSVMLGIDAIWWDNWAALNRPLAGLSPYAALKLTPGSVTGFFVMVVALRMVGAALVYHLVKTFGANRAVALCAGLLFVVNPSEQTRFMLWSIIYHASVVAAMMAIVLFVHSYIVASRALLVLALVFIGISLLHYETAFPIFAAVPLLLFALPRRAGYSIWVWAWYATVAIFALRFLGYLGNVSHPYQTALFIGWGEQPHGVLGWGAMAARNLAYQTATILRYLEFPGAVLDHWREALTSLGFMAALLPLALRKRGQSAAFRYDLAAATALGFAILAIIAFVPLPITAKVPDYGTHPTARYQFFAAPAQSIAWAFLLSAAFSRLKRPSSRAAALTLSAGTICSFAVAGSYHFQAQGGVINPYTDFARTSRLFNEINRQMPKLDRDTAIFISLPEGDLSPVGWGYTVYYYSCLFFGVPGFQGKVDTDGQHRQRMFGYPDSISVAPPACRRIVRFDSNAKGRATFSGIQERGDVSDSSECRCTINRAQYDPAGPLPFLRP